MVKLLKLTKQQKNSVKYYIWLLTQHQTTRTMFLLLHVARYRK